MIWRPWREPIIATGEGAQHLLAQRVPFNAVKLAELADRIGRPRKLSVPDAAAHAGQEDGAHER